MFVVHVYVTCYAETRSNPFNYKKNENKYYKLIMHVYYLFHLTCDDSIYDTIGITLTCVKHWVLYDSVFFYPYQAYASFFNLSNKTCPLTAIDMNKFCSGFYACF